MEWRAGEPPGIRGNFIGSAVSNKVKEVKPPDTFAVTISLERHDVAETTVSFDFDSLVDICESAPLASDSDEALVEGLQQGTGHAYELLILRFQQPVYNLVYRLLEDPGEASDVVQEVFLKVFRHIEKFRGNSSLKTWIYRIAVNEAHNHRRWYSRSRKREVGLENEDMVGGRSYGDVLPDPGQSPFEITLHGETMALIEEALSTMKPVFREAVVLRDIEDLSYEEIGEILQVSLGTVKSRILRGRESLRRALSERLDSNRALGWTQQTAVSD